jgi:amino acid adenylation domain-containing protein
MGDRRKASLVDILHRHAGERPEDVAYRFLDGEKEVAAITYAALDERARAIGAEIQRQGLRGARALLLYPPGLDFVAAFFGCLYGGAVAVPVYLPRLNRPQEGFLSILRDVHPRGVLTLSTVRGEVDLIGKLPGLERATVLSTDALDTGQAGSWEDIRPQPGDLAFLQYTSGSTSRPKGVMVTHGNLMANEETIRRAFDQSKESVIVGWLPLYHDMGLIGNVLQPLYVGASCVLMSPLAFLKRPATWLRAIHRYRGTTSGGPNFSYELCATRIPLAEREGLDLSSWRVAFNGAEPVRRSTQEAFTAAFAPCGFRPEAFYPCYGLAEATLFVTGGSPDETPVVAEVWGEGLERGVAVPAAPGDPSGRSLVSCGRSWTGHRVAVVNPETRRELPSDRVGEIWVAGPSVAHGYWERPEETAATFEGRLDTGEGPFLRTGDLGFLRGGELFVTGRIKDLIILRGRNLYPQDVEWCAEQSHAALRPGFSAAFRTDFEGEERLVVAAEIRREELGADNLAEISAAVRRAVAEEHEAQVWEVVLLPPGAIPKTSSGKVRRSACEAAWRDGSLATVGRDRLSPSREISVPGRIGVAPGRPESPIAAGFALSLDRQILATLPRSEVRSLLALYLRQRLPGLLGVPADRLALDQPLLAQGLDSLRAVELQGDLEVQLGTGPSLASLLEGASALQAIDEALGRLDAAPPEPSPVVAATEEGSPAPPSLGQRALWFLSRLAPESPAYHIAGATRVRSGLDPAALHRWLVRLAERHGALRTEFREEGGVPFRRVRPQEEASVELVTDDVSGWSEEAIADRLHAEVYRPFDLQTGPLLRAVVLSRGGEDCTVGLAVHHIVADFTSLAVLLRELAEIRRAEAHGEESRLAQPATTFEAVVQRERAWLASPRSEESLAWWRERLAGNSGVLDLPTDRPRPAVQTWEGSSVNHRFDAELGEALRRTARDRGITLFTLLLAGFQALLARLSGQSDLVVGSPSAGRVAPDLSGVVGYLVNPLVLRADLLQAASFADLLDQAKEALLAALEHQDCPFPLLVERLQPERDPSRSPLFQVMIVLQRSDLLPGQDLGAFALGEPGAALDLGGLSLESIRLERRGAQFDLSLALAELDGGLGASLEFNTALFDRATARRLLGWLEVLLRAAVADPCQPPQRLPLLTGAEREELVVERNRTRAEHPGGTVHGLVAERAVREPEATALIDGMLRLSRRELESRANALSHALRRLGVGPEDRVGVCLPRDWRLVASLLGILKAGGSYVSLDPSYPQERLQALLDDARPVAVLADAATADRLAGAGAPVIDVADWGSFGTSPDTPPAESGPEGRLAYVIYTSGSTGRPKGVAIAHSSAVALLRWAGEVFAPEEWAGTLASTSISFDLSVFEIFGPLAHGGTVILAETALHLPELPAAGEVTLVNTVPSAMTELVRNRAIPASVRTINLAGEPFGPRLVEKIFTAIGAVRLLNLYGPSEDTTYSTFAAIERGLPGAPPIGGPIAETRAYVVDRHLELLPSGVPGELVLGGAGLARGYLSQPHLTAERFVPDPFSGDPGARLYHTGDLVRSRPDGALEFQGRLDQQVKIRGFRIELEEVASVLAKHPGVAEAVVLARPAEGRLVAYVVAAELEPAALQEFLRERLPAPMVPAVFARLEEMPRTPNGKIDRRALAVIAPVAPEGGEAAPGSLVEELLAGIWSDVLGVERVGAEDDFFSLGGHSLLATQVVSRVREVFGVDLPVRILFEAPTLATLARRIDRASGPSEELPPLVPVPRAEVMPVSFAQQRLWLLDQREPGNAAYNVPEALRLRGPLDLAALRRSFDDVTRRHESLRTTFASREGEPVQVVAPAHPVSLPLVSLQGLPLELREAEVRRLALREAQQPFDLARGPLLRLLLLRLGDEEHVVLVTMHHIISDGWSMGLLTREMTRLYRPHAAGSPAELPALPIQYADFAVWQRAWLRGGLLEEQVDHWRRHLNGVPSILELPTDRPRPRAQTFRGAHLARALPAELTAAVRSFARREGATLFMTFLATFETLVARQAGQPLFAVGTPIANRRRTELEDVIGFFVNTLVLRADLADDQSFAALLAQVRETALDAYAHQDVPFEKLVEALQPDRSPSYSPLFQVLFVQHNAPRASLALEGLVLEPLGVDNQLSKFDLSLSILEVGEVLAVEVEYNTDLFDSTTLERLLGHYECLLAAAAQDPEARTSHLPLLTLAERFQSLVEWNDSACEAARDRCVHDLVEAQAARTPDATAVLFEGSRLTYRELNAQANQLASHLEQLGVRPGDRVGLCVERSLDLPISLLAILKTGAVYVPLDPEYPRDRLLFMLGDAGVSILLTQQGLQNLFSGHPIQLVYLDVDIDTIFSGPGENVDRGVQPDMPGYALYTSGSTGRPKGALLPHRGIANHIQWKQQAFPLAADDRVLQKTRIGFDASLWEFFYAWTAGAELVLARPGGHRDTAYLASLIASEGITVFQFVPSVLRSFLDEPAIVRGRVRRVFAGGEALAPDLVRKFFDRFPVELANVYGPTETSITCCAWVARPGETPEVVPIGRPITNDELFVLDHAGEPVAVGIPGELHVGGAGLASGYIGLPGLTADRFVPHALSRHPGERLYRTGDVVRFRPDGNLELLGRRDDQVKIRGFRIEPGEVESLLAQHPTVRESVVVVREDEPGGKVLVAYVVAGEGPPAPAELRDFLKLKLPDYMIPAAFVTLQEIPLNPNGKVDRAALPAAELSAVAPEKIFVAPRDPVEEMLATFWCEVLHQERVSAFDNFFDLGGHSLLATQVNSRIAQAFQVELPLEDLFAAPTLEALGQRIGRALKGDADLPVPPITRRPEGLPRQLSFAQQRLWIVQRLETNPSVYNNPAVLQLRGKLDPGVLKEAFSEIARRHEVLRTTFHAVDGIPEPRLSEAPEVPLEILDLRRLNEPERRPEVERWLTVEALRPFDLEGGPLFRTALCRVEEDEHLLLINLHHIVCDGWSMGLLVHEMAALYEAFTSGAPSPLPELAYQYADFARWQRQWLQGEVLEAQVAYWREQLSDAAPVLDLPLDRPRPAQQTFSGALRTFELPEALVEGLNGVSRARSATPFMTSLACFAALLARYSGQHDVSLGTPIAGRNRLEIERLIGFFVNTLIIRADLKGNPSFQELLERVRSVSLGAFAHQDVPFEKLVDELRPERSLNTTPLFQVMFAFQNVSQELPHLPDLDLSLLRLHGELSKFDLTLALAEGNGGRLGSVEYNTDLFDAATIDRLLRHLQALMRGVVNSPALPLSALSLLDEAERGEILSRSRGPQLDDPGTGRFHDWIAAQAGTIPERSAVVCCDERLTYGALEAAANRIAHELMTSYGIGPEMRVAVSLRRTASLVPALLGVVKAGGTYVPLDPAYPTERRAFMLRDSGATVLLTEGDLAADLPTDRIPILHLDSEWKRIAARPATGVSVAADPTNLAYLIYTSGSTGHPKAVAIEHRNVEAFLTWAAGAFSREELLGTLASTSISFDLSIFELFLPLLLSGTVILVDNALELGELPEGTPVTLVNTVPSAMAELLRRQAVPASVRTINLAGEALSQSLADTVFRETQAHRLLNLYGPSEDTTYSTYAELAAGGRTSPTIGHPVAGTWIRVLDSELELLPPSVCGELFLGGAGLARGYFGHPALTAERFVPDPFGEEAGARLFRTGDLVRQHSDGKLAFLGRIDRQIKVRGFRIELGEVEAGLLRHPRVRGAVVGTWDRARTGQPGDSVLVAWVVGEGEAPSAAELRTFLEASLPSPMTPSWFVPVQAFPRTPNGKIDYRSLPAPDEVLMETSLDTTPPRTSLEEQVAEIWKQVLKLESLGVHASFFDLGGHSLLASQLVARIQQRFQVSLPMRELFEQPSVARLAQVLESVRSEQEAPSESFSLDAIPILPR